MEVTGFVMIPSATAFFMQQGCPALLQMDEGYKQMGRSYTHKEEDA